MDTLLGIISEMARQPQYSIPAFSIALVGTIYLIRKNIDRHQEQQREELATVLNSIPPEHGDSVRRVAEVLYRQCLNDRPQIERVLQRYNL